MIIHDTKAFIVQSTWILFFNCHFLTVWVSFTVGLLIVPVNFLKVPHFKTTFFNTILQSLKLLTTFVVVVIFYTFTHTRSKYVRSQPDTCVTLTTVYKTIAALSHVTQVRPPKLPVNTWKLSFMLEESSACVDAMGESKKLLFALGSAAAAGILSIIFVLRWVLYFKEGLGWDGGLAEFNWHPVLIVIGFIFLQGMGE